MTRPVVLTETRTLGINSKETGLAVVEYTTVLSINKLERIREDYVKAKIARWQSGPEVATLTKFRFYDENDLHEIMHQLSLYFIGEGYKELVYFAPNETIEVMEGAGFSKVQDVLTPELEVTFMHKSL